jgi:hypothetical protein
MMHLLFGLLFSLPMIVIAQTEKSNTKTYAAAGVAAGGTTSLLFSKKLTKKASELEKAVWTKLMSSRGGYTMQEEAESLKSKILPSDSIRLEYQIDDFFAYKDRLNMELKSTHALEQRLVDKIYPGMDPSKLKALQEKLSITRALKQQCSTELSELFHAELPRYIPGKIKIVRMISGKDVDQISLVSRKGASYIKVSRFSPEKAVLSTTLSRAAVVTSITGFAALAGSIKIATSTLDKSSARLNNSERNTVIDKDTTEVASETLKSVKRQ